MGILVVDCPALCYRAWHKMGGLAYEGQNTGIMYGFLTQLYTLMRPFGRSWSPAFCWDSRKSLRKEIFPDYKRKRHEELSDKDKELRQIAYRQFDLVRRKVLPALGFANNFIEIGYESEGLDPSCWNARPPAMISSATRRSTIGGSLHMAWVSCGTTSARPDSSILMSCPRTGVFCGVCLGRSRLWPRHARRTTT